MCLARRGLGFLLGIVYNTFINLHTDAIPPRHASDHPLR